MKIQSLHVIGWLLVWTNKGSTPDPFLADQTMSILRKIVCVFLAGLPLASLIFNAQAQEIRSSENTNQQTDADGRPLPEGAVAKFGARRFWHKDRIIAMAVSPDGKMIITKTGEEKGHLHFWDSQTGRPIRPSVRTSIPVYKLAISPNGKLLGLGASEGIWLMNLPRGDNLRLFGRIPGRFFQFTSDGNAIISSDRPDGVELWSLATGKRMKHWPIPADTPVPGGVIKHTEGQMSPDGKMITWMGGKQLFSKEGNPGEFVDAHVKVFQANTGKPLYCSKPFSKVESVTFSPNSKYFAVFGKTVEIHMSRDGKLLHQLPGFPPYWQGMFSRDGQHLIMRGKGQISCWNSSTGKKLSKFHYDHLVLNHMSAVSTQPSNERILWMSTDNVVRGWNVMTGKEFPNFQEHRHRIRRLSFSRNGKELTSECFEAMSNWDHITGKQLKYQWIHELRPNERLREFSTSQQRAIWETGPKEFQLQNLVSGKIIAKHQMDKNLADTGIYFFGRTLLAAELVDSFLAPKSKIKSSTVCQRFDALSGEELERVEYPANLFGLIDCQPTATEDGKFIAATNSQGRIILLDSPLGKVVREFVPPRRGDWSAWWLQFSKDGKYLAAALVYRRLPNDKNPNNDPIQIWETHTGRPVCRIVSPSQSIGLNVDHSLAFSADGRLIALSFVPISKPEEITVHVWETVSSTERGQLKTKQFGVSALAFSKDGNYLATGGYDTTILVWDVHRPFGKQPFKSPLSDKQLTVCWNRLAAPIASDADAAQWALVHSASESLPFLQKYLQPAPVIKVKQIKRWIADLGSDDFKVRQMVAAALEKIPNSALPLLVESGKKPPSVEVHLRLKKLIEKAKNPIPSPAALRQIRAVEVLERIGNTKARQILRALAKGQPAARQTREAHNALKRLQRK